MPMGMSMVLRVLMVVLIIPAVAGNLCYRSAVTGWFGCW